MNVSRALRAYASDWCGRTAGHVSVALVRDPRYEIKLVPYEVITFKASNLMYPIT